MQKSNYFLPAHSFRPTYEFRVFPKRFINILFFITYSLGLDHDLWMLFYFAPLLIAGSIFFFKIWKISAQTKQHSMEVSPYIFFIIIILSLLCNFLYFKNYLFSILDYCLHVVKYAVSLKRGEFDAVSDDFILIERFMRIFSIILFVLHPLYLTAISYDLRRQEKCMIKGKKKGEEDIYENTV